MDLILVAEILKLDVSTGCVESSGNEKNLNNFSAVQFTKKLI
jgi:hypothetical protein